MCFSHPLPPRSCSSLKCGFIKLTRLEFKIHWPDRHHRVPPVGPVRQTVLAKWNIFLNRRDVGLDKIHTVGCYANFTHLTGLFPSIVHLVLGLGLHWADHSGLTRLVDLQIRVQLKHLAIYNQPMNSFRNKSLDANQWANYFISWENVYNFNFGRLL